MVLIKFVYQEQSCTTLFVPIVLDTESPPLTCPSSLRGHFLFLLHFFLPLIFFMWTSVVTKSCHSIRYFFQWLDGVSAHLWGFVSYDLGKLMWSPGLCVCNLPLEVSCVALMELLILRIFSFMSTQALHVRLRVHCTRSCVHEETVPATHSLKFRQHKAKREKSVIQ